MDRKGFLKNVFGAGIVLAMPKVLVDKIETLPPPAVEKKKQQFLSHEGFVDSKTNIKVEPIKDNCMYLYKNEHLLAYSYENNIEMHRPLTVLESIEREYPEYSPGLASWSISMNHIKWLEGWGLLDEYLISQIPITMLFKKGDTIIQGDVMVIERNNIWLGSGWVDIKCRGCGALTIDTNDSTTAKK